MKINQKYTVLGLAISVLFATSCEKEQSKEAESLSAREKVLAEMEKAPVTKENAVTLSMSRIMKFVMKNQRFDMGDNPKLEELTDRKYELEAAHKAAMYAHPDLAELVKAKENPDLEMGEGFALLGQMMQKADTIPELRAMKDEANDAAIAEVEEFANVYEARGQKELAEDLREILARVE